MRVGLRRPAHGEEADLYAELAEQLQQSPCAPAGTVLKDRLDERTPQSFEPCKADVGQHVLRMAVAFEDRVLATTFVVEVDVDRDARTARPLRIGKAIAVPMKSRGVASCVMGRALRRISSGSSVACLCGARYHQIGNAERPFWQSGVREDDMLIRDGEGYTRSLRDGRTVYIDGKQVGT